MKKIFSIIGMAVSCVIILLGIMVMAGELTNGYDYYSTAGYSYDSGAASFGGDFYTFVNNNAYEAAAAAQATSRNVGNLIRNVDVIAGILLMGMGAFGLLGFGIVFAGTREFKFTYSAPAAPRSLRTGSRSSPSITGISPPPRATFSPTCRTRIKSKGQLLAAPLCILCRVGGGPQRSPLQYVFRRECRGDLYGRPPTSVEERT